MTPQYRSAGKVVDSVEDQLVLMAVVFRSEFENVYMSGLSIYLVTGCRLTAKRAISIFYVTFLGSGCVA